MPAALPGIAGFAVASLVPGGALIAGIAGGLVAYGTTKVLGLDKPPKLDDPGIKANVVGTVEAIPIIYGRRKVGGAFAQVMTTGEVNTSVTMLFFGNPDYPTWGLGPPIVPQGSVDNKILNLVIVWGEGEIEEIESIYFGDLLATDPKFDDAWDHEDFLGTDGQSASQMFLDTLADTFTPESADEFWNADHKLSGVAYSYFRLGYKPGVWVSGVPTITAIIKGKKVLDLRDSVTKYSTNPALCVYDYLTNTRYGRGIPVAEIDTQSFIDAANYCDQEVEIPFPIANLHQARYECDAILSPNDTALDNLKVLLGTCRGALIFSGGLYKLKIDKPEVSSFTLTEDNIVGGWNILLESSETRVNRVHAQWRNSNSDWKSDLKIVESPEYLLADGGEVLEARIDLPATTNWARPRQMAGIVLRQSRYSMECEVTCNLEGLQCEVFDVIGVTHWLPGWTNQLFRVMGITIEGDGLVRLQLRQYSDSVYDLDSQNEEDSPPPTNLPDPRYVPPIEYLEAAALVNTYADGTVLSMIQLIWASSIEVNLQSYELKYKKSTASGWESVRIPFIDSASQPGAPSFQYYQLHKPQAETWNIELRTIGPLGTSSVPYIATLVPA